MEKQVLFEVKDLCKYFPASHKRSVKAVDRVTLNIYKGETLSLVGESGCGKTTLGRTILGVYPKTSGEILYQGQDREKASAQQKKQFQKDNQMIFQDPYSCLDPRMSIGSIIEEGMKVHFSMSPSQRQKRCQELLERVGLPREMLSRFPHELSGGQRQRIGIARALSLNPQFIVCDEPVSALDVSIQAQILNLLMDLQSEMDLTYMFVTHDLSVVRHISDHIMVMYLGESLEYAEADELFNSPLHPYTRALLSSIPEPDISMRNKKISVIKGEVVSPINPKPGCRFAPRCENCMEICTQCSPELKEVAPGHLVACHKYA